MLVVITPLVRFPFIHPCIAFLAEIAYVIMMLMTGFPCGKQILGAMEQGNPENRSLGNWKNGQ